MKRQIRVKVGRHQLDDRVVLEYQRIRLLGKRAFIKNLILIRNPTIVILQETKLMKIDQLTIKYLSSS